MHFEISQVFLVIFITGIFSIAMFLLMILMQRARKDRYDHELKKAELDLLRQSIEGKIYDLNDRLFSNNARGLDVNHLLLDAARSNDKIMSSKIGNFETKRTRFIDALGIGSDDNHIIPKTIFVLIPFHPRFDPIFEIIRSVCADVGLRASRGDEAHITGPLLPHIIKQLVQSQLVIACVDGRNPNVFYELGLAHAMDKPTIMLTSELENLPFDVTTFQLLVFNTLSDLKQKLGKALTRLLIDKI